MPERERGGFYLEYTPLTLVGEELTTAVRELAERTSNGHSFEAYLLAVCVYSQTEHEPQGGEPMSAELDE